MSPCTDVHVCELVLFLSHREGCGVLPLTPVALLHGEAPSPLIPCSLPTAERDAALSFWGPLTRRRGQL